jgi:hypothetical protein
MYAPGIVRGNRLAMEHVAEVTALRLRETPSGDGNLVVEATKESFSAGHAHLSPTFAVVDDRVQVLARYADSNEVAVASRDAGEWTSVYCGALQMPVRLLRDLARQAGVHIHSDQGDIVTAGSGFIGLHACSEGRETLRMPSACRLEDVVTGEVLGPAVDFGFDMKLGDTRLLRVVW